MNQSSSVASYPPPQKYARLSVAQVPRRRSLNDALRQPVSTFRSLAFLHKKPRHKSSELEVKTNTAKKMANCFTAAFSSACFHRKKNKSDESKYFVLKQPDQDEGVSFADYAAQLVRRKRRFLLSQMSRVQPYQMDQHCWRDWGHTRVINTLSQMFSDIPGDKSKVGYKPPRLTEEEVSTLLRSGPYMCEGWEEWAAIRYPNGTRVHGPPLP